MTAPRYNARGEVRCCMCGRYLPANQFARRGTSVRTGAPLYVAYCRPCFRDYDRARRGRAGAVTGTPTPRLIDRLIAFSRRVLADIAVRQRRAA